MFLSELKPLTQELCRQPLAFAGGFVSGALRLKLGEDPLRAWLSKQGLSEYSANDFSGAETRPQNISID
ncbi:MAG: hypothetical protein ACK5CA_05170 [Cyanobacteriota bacterium]|jgi:hypothetical protein